MVAYGLMLVLVGVPVAWAEWSIGRRGGQMGAHCAPGVFWYLTKGSRLWKFLGVLAVLGPSSVAFYYMVVEAWCCGYFWKMLTQPEVFATAEGTAQTFFSFTGMYGDGSALLSDNGLLWIVGGVILLNLVIIYRGISKGIEMFSRWFMPLLLLISLVLLVRILCIGTPDPSYPDRSIEQGLGYMWNPSKVLVEELDRDSGDWKTVSMVSASHAGALDEAVRQVEMSGGTRRLTEVTLWDGLKNIELWIAAAGQVFLSLSVGTGLILTYASYVRKKEDIALSGFSAAASNEVCEVGIAGMMTVPAAVAFLGVAGAAGQGTFALGFMVLPQAFAKMGSSVVFGSLFFLLLTVAAVTSSISMMQVGLSFIEIHGAETQNGCGGAGLFTATGTFIVAWYSGNLLAMDTYDFSGHAVLLCERHGDDDSFSWKLGVDRGLKDLEDSSVIRIPRIYRFIMKFVTPTLLLAIFLTWLAQNIWVKQAAPIEALGRGEHGAVIPMGFLAAYTLFLLFITMASGRHKVYHGPR
ncbi:MAG: sodium:calcium symporter [Akkermansia sp.]